MSKLDRLPSYRVPFEHCSGGHVVVDRVADLAVPTPPRGLLHDQVTVVSHAALTAACRARIEAEDAAHLNEDRVVVVEPATVADVAYLRAAPTAVDEQCGDRSSYLCDGLGLDDSVIIRLREFLLPRDRKDP